MKISGAAVARVYIERLIIAKLLTTLSRAGFKPTAIEYGDGPQKLSSHKAVMEVVFDTDDGYIYFTHDQWVRYVCGNSGYDIINDYTAGIPAFADCLKAVSQWIDEEFNC